LAEIPLSYYFNWQGLEDFRYSFDADNIPRVDYGAEIGLRYNAITIAQYGLFCLQKYSFSKNPTDQQRALNCADWLIDNAREWHNGSAAWVYNFDLDFYRTPAPWISAMAQGEGISLLLRAYLLKAKSDYIDIARKAIRTFHYPVSDGGVVDYLEDVHIVFEEYPVQPPVHVLNGHIFALLGLYDYACFFDDQEIMDLVHNGLDTIEKKWQMWDVGFWTLYDLHTTRRLASRMYHELHIRQMRLLAELFHRESFYLIAQRWTDMQKSVICNVRWYIGKIAEKVRLRRGNR